MEVFQSRRAWLGGGAVFAVLLVAASWFLLISPELSSASGLRDQSASTRQTNQVLQIKVNSLKAKSANIGQYRLSLKNALATLPFDSGLPAFTRQVTAQAAHNHVTLSSVTVSGVSAAAAAAPATAAPGTDATTAAPSTDSTTSTAPTTPTTPANGATAGSVYGVQVSLVSQGSLAHQEAFLHDIQYRGPRRALVSSTQFTTGTGSKVASIDPSTSMTTQLTVFSAPQTPEQIAHLEKLLSGKLGN